MPLISRLKRRITPDPIGRVEPKFGRIAIPSESFPPFSPDIRDPGEAAETIHLAAPVLSVDPNVWIPNSPLLPRAPSKDRGAILAVIPTAGRNPTSLDRLLNSLISASDGCEVRIVLVVCPSTRCDLTELARIVDGRAEIVPVPGAFNFCRSVNIGLSHRKTEGYALILNDDVQFLYRNTLSELKEMLRQQSWAACGPWVDSPSKWEPDGPCRYMACHTHQPLINCCALYDFKWIERVGLLDERYGIGWGYDESDWFLRALRLGARWGRAEQVAVTHAEHGTFGPGNAAHSPAHQLNKSVFEAQNPGVGSWGETHHWNSLPGIAAIIAGHNVAPWLARALQSVERALDGFRFIMSYADDASEDASLGVALEHESAADLFRVSSHPKASNAGQAKNRALREIAPCLRQYPAIFWMDADDVMLRARAERLYTARDSGELLRRGPHVVKSPNPERHGLLIHGPGQQAEGWLSPCTTIMHASLIPEDGVFWPEQMVSHEDAARWVQLWREGVRGTYDPLDVEPWHEYHARFGSVSNNPDTARHNQEWAKLQAKIRDGKVSV